MLSFKRTQLAVCVSIIYSSFTPFVNAQSDNVSLESILVEGEQSQLKIDIKSKVEAEKALTPGAVTVVDGVELFQRNM